MSVWIERAIKEDYIQKYSHEVFENEEGCGEGRFGEVDRADWPHTNRKVALKRLKNYDVGKFTLEVKMHNASHSSKNIIRFLGLVEESDQELKKTYVMVLEYADQSNLRSFLQKDANLLWDDKIKLSLDIAKGLSYMSYLKIAHRDLHSRNVVVSQLHYCDRVEYIAKITDFGSAIKMDGNNDNDITEVIGQIPFTDPKYLNDRRHRKSLKSDVYSLGVILWEISSHKIPFSNYMPNSRGDFRDLSLTLDIIAGLRERRTSRTSDGFVKLYQSCWDYEEDQRPDIKDVVESLEKIIPLESLGIPFKAGDEV